MFSLINNRFPNQPNYVGPVGVGGNAPLVSQGGTDREPPPMGLDYFDQYGNQPGMGGYRQPGGMGVAIGEPPPGTTPGGGVAQRVDENGMPVGQAGGPGSDDINYLPRGRGRGRFPGGYGGGFPGGYGGGQQYGFGGYGGYAPFMLGGMGGFGGGYNPYMGGLGGLFGGMGGQGYGYSPMMGGFGGFGGFTPMGYGGYGGMGGYGGFPAFY